MKNRFFIPLLVGGLVSAAALYLAFRNVPFNDLWRYLGTIQYGWIIPTAALILLSFFLRALRWQILLQEAGKVSFWQAFHPMMIGFMMNCILPARVGEIARPVILKQQRGIPISTGISTVVAERVFDILLLIVLFAVLFADISSRPAVEQTYFGMNLNSEVLMSVAWGMVRLSIALLVFISLLTIDFTRNLMKNAVYAVARYADKSGSRLGSITGTICNLIIKIIDNFYTGLTMVKRPARLIAAIGLTILIWAVSAFSYWVFAQGCPGIDLSFVEFTTVMVVICFFIALPSVPGFWGLWEAAGVFALALFGIPEKDALGFTLINHAVQLFPVIGTGLISALVTGVNFWQVSRHDHAMDLQSPSHKGA